MKYPKQCDRLKELRAQREEVGLLARPPKEEVEAAERVFEKVRHVFLRQPGVTAVDVGFEIVDGEDRFTGKVAVRVHVENKQVEGVLRESGRTPISDLDLEKLTGLEVRPPFEDRVERESPRPREPRVPVELKDEITKEFVPIDVIQARYLPSNGAIQIGQPKLSDREFDDDDMLEFATEPVHPLVGGVSIGTDRGPAGTLGAIVWDGTDGAPCLLSNWHVLAGSPSATVGQPCYQPAIFDGGQVEADAVGALKRWYFGRRGDAALAEITCDRPYAAGEVLGLHVPVVGTVEPELGMPVRKWGRTTGFSKGFIDGIHLTISINYTGVGTQRFDEQVHIAGCETGAEVSVQGDSGALWVTKYVPYDPGGNGKEDPGGNGKEDPEGNGEDAGSDEADSASRHGEGGEAGKEARNKNDRQRTGDRKEKPRAHGRRVYYAVALHFAGDAPGAKSGEFAVASPIHDLAERLKFSFRPVFFPNSGFVIKPASTKPSRPGRTLRGGSPVRPGGVADDGPTGPQPIPDPLGEGGS